MTTLPLKVADLDEAHLDRLRALEADLGTTIVAYQPESPYAPLDAEQLSRLQRLERELGVVLLAYRREDQDRSA